MGLLAGWMASLSNSHFDGILDFHTGRPASLWVILSEGIIDWLIMALLVLAAGALVSRSSFRVIDVLGTQALARFPTLFIAPMGLLIVSNEFMAQLRDNPSGIGELAARHTTDYVLFNVILAVTIVMSIWMVYLVYKAFSVSCHVQGARAIVTFIGVIIIGELASKHIMIFYLIR